MAQQQLPEEAPEFDDYLKCGLLEHGFLRVKCDACSQEHLVAFSCKRRGFCPSCGARRMVESADMRIRRHWSFYTVRDRDSAQTVFS